MYKTLAFLVLLLPFQANADCYCACVNGSPASICEKPFDTPKSCVMVCAPVAKPMPLGPTYMSPHIGTPSGFGSAFSQGLEGSAARYQNQRQFDQTR